MMTATKEFRVVSNQFGYPMYAAGVVPGWSDQIADSHVYDEEDSRETKLRYWRANASIHGLDPDCVQIEEA